MRAAAPLVSVLLPAFNAAATLDACLRSIARQRERRWECVVVDDGSEDETQPLARRFAARDERFRVVPIAHGGVVAALNYGIAHCRGEFVARMDADDLMHRERLRAQVQALQAAPELAAVGCRVRLFPRRGLRDGRRAYERWLNGISMPDGVRREAFVECPVAHPTLTIRRGVLRRLGYRDCGWPEDYDLILRLLAGGYGIGVVPRRLLSWRDRAGRLSRVAPAYGLERFVACKAAFLAGGFLAAHETYGLWGYGPTGRSLRRALQGHGKRPAYVIEVDPRRIGRTVHDAPVLPPERLPCLPRRPLVIAVAGERPRHQIRVALAGMGFRELHDFVCAA